MSTTTTAIAALNRAVYYLDRGFEPAAKAKAFTRAAEVAAGMDDDDLERRAEAGTLTDLDGIGPSTASVIADAVLDRPPAYLTKLEQRTRLRVSAGATVFEACRSDLHSHSTWSDGGAPIRTMAMTARALVAPLSSMNRMELAPASITTLTWYADGNASMRSFAESAHLEGVGHTWLP